MKNLFAIILLFPLFSASAFENKIQKQSRAKNKAAQTKVFRKHQSNWRQPNYHHDTILFQCYDSWNHHLRGKFTSEQQYFIELGGGSCQRVYHQPQPQYNSALEKFDEYNFSLRYVYKAIEKIKTRYHLRRARVVETEDIDAGYKTFKYTLIFQVGRDHYREFRVKHKRRNGKIRSINEI